MNRAEKAAPFMRCMESKLFFLLPPVGFATGLTGPHEVAWEGGNK
jgi:hypothetical protein